ncbi:MAG: S41 family peptidase [Bacteroidaceae bacterium]|nr:S41 family peptidase [Bacteroidaceae bacterium]
MSKSKSSRYLPIIIVASIVVGIVIGTFYANHFSGNRLNIINTSSNKINDLLHIVDNLYVDSVDVIKLVEEAMPQILSELDPHSTYIPAEELEESNAELKGSFSGIGVQFTIQSDTVHINSVIKGGPSEKVGLMAGDRIISIDDSAFVGDIVTNAETMRRLKGPKGTQVKLGIHRQGEKRPLDFTIIRGDIPIKSIDAAYPITDELGYVRINKFSETTYPELLIALAGFKQLDCNGVIIDLRGNTGGYMSAAIQMVNEFLPEDRLIVYTEGRKSPREEYRSNGRGNVQDIAIVVLMDETSASASEIFAGAIQDNDRGTIVGRRSFGKGLVQQPIEFRDGSAMRLTIARYYTPAGRCIQKPYNKGKDKDYERDLMTRYEHGEFFSQDSIHQDESSVFYTHIGRPVYGGGGIMPDLFIPQDTSNYTSYYKSAAMRGLLVKFAFDYTDKNRNRLNEYTTEAAMENYLKRQHILEQFARYAEQRDLKRRNNMLYKSRALFEEALYGNIIYNMLGMEEYIKYLNKTDPAVQRAVEVLEKGESYPKAPEKKNNESETPAA